MKRRDFLSMLSCAAIASIVPRPKYFFLNGVWQPNAIRIDYGTANGVIGIQLWRTDANLRNWVLIEDRYQRDGRIFRRIEHGPEEEMPNCANLCEPPFVIMGSVQTPWANCNLQPEETR